MKRASSFSNPNPNKTESLDKKLVWDLSTSDRRLQIFRAVSTSYFYGSSKSKNHIHHYFKLEMIFPKVK